MYIHTIYIYSIDIHMFFHMVTLLSITLCQLKWSSVSGSSKTLGVFHHVQSESWMKNCHPRMGQAMLWNTPWFPVIFSHEPIHWYILISHLLPICYLFLESYVYGASAFFMIFRTFNGACHVAGCAWGDYGHWWFVAIPAGSGLGKQRWMMASDFYDLWWW